MQAKKLLLAIVLGTAMAAGMAMYVNHARTAAIPVAARVLPASAELPEFELLDQAGTAIGRDVFVGQWDLVFFGFTNCPDICPITLQLMSTARRQLEEAGNDPLPRIVLLSVDPERDTPESLAHYLGAFGDDSLGITGEIDEIRKLTERIGIFFQKQSADDNGYYAVDHSSVVIVIDPEGRWHSLFSSPHSIENFVNDIPLLIESWSPYSAT